MKKEKTRKKTGRPEYKIDFDQVDRMCAIHCTGEEIAGVLNINYDTLNEQIKRHFKMSFPEYFKKKSAPGKMSLRRAQFKTANDGNPTMLVWLGKQYLGQTDKAEYSEEQSATPVKIEINVENARIRDESESDT